MTKTLENDDQDVLDYKVMKYFTKQLFLEAIDAAKREKRSHIIIRDLVEALPDDFLTPIAYTYYHNENEIRVIVFIAYFSKPHTLDMGIKRYNSLPTAKCFNDGRIEFESEESMQDRRPYGQRDFEEKIHVKPLRTSNFRSRLIKEYEGMCAMCDVKEPLVGAHIVPVAKGGNDSIKNGILLCKNHDHLFEYGKLRIQPDGTVVGDSELTFLKTIRKPKNPKSHPLPENFAKKLTLIENQ